MQPGIPDFDYAGDFHNGLSLVRIQEKGCGYIDRNMNLVIPMKYDRAYAFRNGRATMELNGIWYTADTAGNLTEIRPGPHSSQYRCFGNYSEGLCKASTIRFEPEDMTYQSESADFAECWGFVDESGREVIPPQYVYAYNFKDGTAFVCKGELIIDEKADDRHGREKYRTEGEKWGAIDREGNEVVPFIFDDIDFFLDTKDVLMACIGTGKDERWGVIDHRGNWLAEPMFEEIYQEYQDGLFAFWGADKWHANFRALGIYDIRQRRIAFEPQFSDITFTEDGWIEVSAYDKELDDYVDKLIDINGNEKFPSVYTCIAAWRKPYEVSIWTESEDRHGLIDENGNAVLTCKYHTNWRGIYYEQ